MHIKKAVRNIFGLILISAVSTNAHAFDSKTLSGGICKATKGHQQSDVRYFRSSIQNISSSFRWVTCPIVRDDTDNTNGTRYVRVWIKNQSPTKTSCVLETYSPYGNWIAGDGDLGQGDTNLVMSVSSSVVDGTYSLRCYLPARARITTIRSEEW